MKRATWPIWDLIPGGDFEKKGTFAVLILAACLAGTTTGCQTQKSPDLPASRLPAADTQLLAEGRMDAAESKLAVPPGASFSQLDSICLAYGLKNLALEDSSLRFFLAYSTPDNFLGEDVYGDFDNCYLQPAATAMLLKAHAWLKSNHPNLRFLVFDGARPVSVQRKMWDLVKGTEKNIYVSPPDKGSLHNYGCAIDLTLFHLDTGEVDMGTPFDFFGPEAQPRLEQAMLAAGKVNRQHLENRAILNQAMSQAGFRRLLSEWWHFNACTREEAAARYRILP